MTSTIELAVERLARRRPAVDPAAAVAAMPATAGTAEAIETVEVVEAIQTVDTVEAIEPVEPVVPAPRSGVRRHRGADPVAEPPVSLPPWWSGERPAPCGPAGAC